IWLLLWGVLALLGGLLFGSVASGHASSDQTVGPLGGVLLYSQIVIGLLMISFAIYCLAVQSPNTILLEAGWLCLSGSVNILLSFFSMVGVGMRFNCLSIFAGLIQLAWGIREFRKYKIVSSWAPDFKATPPEQRKQVRRHIKAFLKGDEDYFQGRIKAAAKESSFLVSRRQKGYRGQLLEGVAILISKLMDNCFCFERDDAGVATYNNNVMTAIRTDQGSKKLRLGAISMLAVKSWAGVAVTEKDLWRAVKGKKVSLELLRVFLEDVNPALRITALELLKKVKKDSNAAVAATERFQDADAAVRAAALNVCNHLRAGELHEKVIPLLRDDDNRVRGAAVAYLARFPSSSAVQDLQVALQTEEDRIVCNQIDKALKACEKAIANPYTGF
ncbi:MAG: HEAT repeat domain-containing protein, partial [Planctomycetota bacterium]|nr:HEAT repeat domain-containing protein [Planctomycetota bacterium]